MKKPITKEHFSFICPMNWDDMAPSENGRFCSKCSKEVYDLTECSLDELRELQRKRGKVCGMIKATGAAAVAAASMGSAACQNPHTSRTLGYIPPAEVSESNGQNGQEAKRLLGVPLPPPPKGENTQRD